MVSISARSHITPFFDRWRRGALAKRDLEIGAAAVLAYVFIVTPFAVSIESVELVNGIDRVVIIAARVSAAPLICLAACTMYGYRKSPLLLRQRLAFLVGLIVILTFCGVWLSTYVLAVNKFVGRTRLIHVSGTVIAKDESYRRSRKRMLTVIILRSDTDEIAEYLLDTEQYETATIGERATLTFKQGSLGIFYR